MLDLKNSIDRRNYFDVSSMTTGSIHISSKNEKNVVHRKGNVKRYILFKMAFMDELPSD
jgi:hypothetical protein